ncbi:hypothetical protein K488DRAFT_46101 [Vararia minispora EC-137]|uniref:Uncharacterized protein n=1 Tax=Vararia minispora EC-137 TaxID=1314806 RepID=A0ACB8QR41_9AGAM|nr:hypothetical protein K488DRAFT_46101 [Vararia minispora EC-137]
MTYYDGGTNLLPAHYLQALDESFYGLDAEEAAFYKQQTGIQDDAELKQHIMAVQAKAYSVFPYPCIRRFAFTQLKISRLFAYRGFLNLGKTRKSPIFLDIGCCFGNDIRKAVADGYPAECVIGSDLQKDFWNLGHELFRTTPETFPVPFVGGDAFNPEHLAVVPPFTPANQPTTPPPDLKSLTSLNPLRGHVSAIHASSFFHLFREDSQLHLARALAGLLSPEPGSMIFGSHASLPEKGLRVIRKDGDDKRSMFCHSPESWTELWDGVIFEKGEVKVEATLKLLQRPNILLGEDAAQTAHIMSYCITRL